MKYYHIQKNLSENTYANKIQCEMGHKNKELNLNILHNYVCRSRRITVKRTLLILMIIIIWPMEYLTG